MLYICTRKSKGYGSVAQLNRVLDYGSSGSRFESWRSHKAVIERLPLLFLYTIPEYSNFTVIRCGAVLHSLYNGIAPPLSLPKHVGGVQNKKNGRITFRFSAQDETRTHTGLRPPPPQSGVSTNFTTWAIPLFCECKGSNNFLFCKLFGNFF